jgi:DNA-binding MarR family transcriptional regulator
MADSNPPGQDAWLAELEHAAAFGAELRRFLRRTETAVAEAGLTPRRLDLLIVLKTAGGQATINGLASLLQMRQNAVTELVKRAEEAGVTRRTRSTIDRRVVNVSITPEGERRLRRGLEPLRSERAALAGALAQLGSSGKAAAREQLAGGAAAAARKRAGGVTGSSGERR